MQRAEEEIARHPRLIEESQQYVEDLITKIQEEFKESRATLNERVADLTVTYTNQLQDLQEHLQAVLHKVDQMAETFTVQISQINADLLDSRGKMKQWQQQLEAHSTNQTTLFGTLEASLTGLQARQNDMQQQLGTLEKDQARAIADLHSQLTKESLEIAERITALSDEASAGKAEAVEIKSRSEAQEHRLTELFCLIQEEMARSPAKTSGVAQKPSKTGPRSAQEIRE